MPFTVQETASYIAARLRTAGGDASRLFTREAVMAIHEFSRGIPRTISVICDNALVSGMALNVQPVGRDIVLEVCRDFDLQASNGRDETAYFGAAEGRVPADESRESDNAQSDAPSQSEGSQRKSNVLGLRGR
jgi:hypothetical protein